MVSAPLRDRFGLVHRLEFYEAADLQQIIARSAGILQVHADEDGLAEIARRSRGTPRVANRLLRRVRDYAQVTSDGAITRDIALECLGRLEVDSLGLDMVDHQVLRAIVEKFGGGPVGLETISAVHQ